MDLISRFLQNSRNFIHLKINPLKVYWALQGGIQNFSKIGIWVVIMISHLFLIKLTPIDGLVLALFGVKSLLKIDKKAYSVRIKCYWKNILLYWIYVINYLSNEFCLKIFGHLFQKLGTGMFGMLSFSPWCCSHTLSKNCI